MSSTTCFQLNADTDTSKSRPLAMDSHAPKSSPLPVSRADATQHNVHNQAKQSNCKTK